MIRKKQRIAIDMDDVMADVSTHFINWYETKTNTRIADHQLIGLPVHDAFPNRELARSFLYEPGFFRSIPVMKDSQEVIRQLNEAYEVFIVSAAMEFPQSLLEKYEWLQEHFPFLSWQQMVLCGSKALIKADYMIDDHLKNLDYFEGEKILFSAPHNQLVEGYTRVHNWKEIAEMFLAIPDTIDIQ